jgi:hypothetical protein
LTIQGKKRRCGMVGGNLCHNGYTLSVNDRCQILGPNQSFVMTQMDDVLVIAANLS